MESFIKVLKSTLSYDFLKQIDLDDIVDTTKKFQDLPQQSMIIEIIPICKLPLVNPATITAGKLKVLFCSYNRFKNLVPFNNDYRKVLNSHKERIDKYLTRQVNETRKNYGAAVHGHTFFVTNSFLVFKTIKT